MARDVAIRELDQNNKRIVNLGDPKEKGDATKVDVLAVPKAAAGSGNPGSSLLAAAADHVHPEAPAGPGSTKPWAFYDRSTQSVSGGPDLLWETIVPVHELSGVGDLIGIDLLADVQAIGGKGTIEIRIGGAPGQPNGDLAGLSEVFPDGSVPFRTITAGGTIPTTGIVPIKVVAFTKEPQASVRVGNKTMLLRRVVNA